MSEVPLYSAVPRKHGLSTEQYPVTAYVGSSKNLKDLKDQWTVARMSGTEPARPPEQ